MAQVNQPNTFEVKGKRYSVTYASTSINGEPTLTCTYGDSNSHSFRGKDIRRLDTEIGQQVTVTLKEDADRQKITLTLLIPAINLGLDEHEMPFTTSLIITTHHTSLGGPQLVKGALQLYYVEEMKGTARTIHY